MEEDVTSDLQIAALCVISLFGFCFNGLVFLLLYRKPNMRTFSNRFVLSLATSHLLQCIIIIPAMIASIWGLAFTRVWCQITTTFTICLNLASVLSILLIAIDRNCAVNSPLHYTLTITNKRTSLLIVAIWLVAIVLSLPVLIGMPEATNARYLQAGLITSSDPTSITYSLSISFVGFVVPFINVACLYFAMFRAAKNNNARTRRSSSNSSASNEVIVNIKQPLKKLGVTEYTLRRNYSSDHVDPKDIGCCFAGKHKAAVTGLLVVVSFVTCWLPFYSTLVTDVFVPLSSDLRYLVNFASYTSCIINPYLYFFRNKNTWREAKKMVVGFFVRRNKFSLSQNLKKTTIDLSSSLFRLPDNLSQSVLAMNTSHINSLCTDSPTINVSLQTVVYQEKKSFSNTRGIFSLDPVKPLLHQDSSSSNDSSDACATTVVMGSVLSIFEDSLIWYQPFQSGMVDVPLQ